MSVDTNQHKATISDTWADTRDYGYTLTSQAYEAHFFRACVAFNELSFVKDIIFI
jgi:hypothetical protein